MSDYELFKTLRKTSPEEIVFVLMTLSNQKRINPTGTRGICAQTELSTLYSYLLHSIENEKTSSGCKDGILEKCRNSQETVRTKK